MNGPSIIRASWKGDMSPKQKAARMEEWGQFPLRELSDLERWLEAKSDQFTIVSDVRDAQGTITIGAIESTNSATQRQDSRPSNMSGMLIGTDSPDSDRLDRQVTSSNMQTNRQLSVNPATSALTAGRVSWAETSRHGLPGQIQASSGEVMIPEEENQIGKAGHLSKMHPVIYF
ncbi:hypothetical protein Asppvi_010008 [Aspergillus pseudoviridinutans]|uniref:Uncharacterized protein n=1 Tax=Aspergillus pseudoviridinutans TaxID=1517512 RepID=A0A9P3EZI8_9EURO|nr:uncharacterized protein Asppvi_010008 [Aspergillus pseudoviridinutans]GIJ91043.1 hypothetical protein Asppvi_010008 [Aspergillus pseudoviridinutans]